MEEEKKESITEPTKEDLFKENPDDLFMYLIWLWLSRNRTTRILLSCLIPISLRRWVECCSCYFVIALKPLMLLTFRGIRRKHKQAR